MQILAHDNEYEYGIYCHAEHTARGHIALFWGCRLPTFDRHFARAPHPDGTARVVVWSWPSPSGCAVTCLFGTTSSLPEAEPVGRRWLRLVG